MPRLTDRQMDIVKGLLLGDAYMKNNNLSISMTNLDFLEWIDEELSVLSTGVRLKGRGKELAEMQMKCDTNTIKNPEKVKDQYILRLRTHRQIKPLKRWYKTGNKIFPKDLELTPLLVKVWYCCDGWLQFSNTSHNGNPIIALTSQPDSIVEEYKRKLQKKGIRVSIQKKKWLYVKSISDKKFFRWLGDPLPGFKYKWEYDNKGLYKGRKKKIDGIDRAEEIIERNKVTYDDALSW